MHFKVIPNTDISGYKMEWRKCACGCKRKFRVLKKSPQVFAAETCNEEIDTRTYRRSKYQTVPLPTDYATASETAAAVGLSPPTIYAYAKSKKIPSKRFGKKIGFHIASVKAALKKVKAG